MLRHACGYALANKGHDTRAIQAWLGHRSITSTAGRTGSRTSGGTDAIRRTWWRRRLRPRVKRNWRPPRTSGSSRRPWRCSKTTHRPRRRGGDCGPPGAPRRVIYRQRRAHRNGR
jgi:type 1 fimbriae regulatory protein FimB/type 1 fimbriae regulatory protein FimE